MFLVRAPGSRLDAPDAERAGRALVADLRDDPNLENVVAYWDAKQPALRSEDGREALVLAHVKGDETQQRKNAKTVIDEYTGVREGGLSVQAGGGGAVGNDMETQTPKDLLLAEAIAVPLTLLLLLIVFGSVVAALLPLAIGTIAITGTFAELALLGGVVDVSVSATNLTTALGLGLGIDYALLMISRFREQLATGSTVDDAVRHTVHTAGRTVAFSAATVAVALAALLVFPQYFLRSFGYAGVGVVAIAAVGTLFVMPALLVVLGHRVDSGRLPWAKRARTATRAPLWGRLAGTVMRRPVLTALPVLAVLLVAASPLLGITLGTPTNAYCPRTRRAARSPPSCGRSSTATTTPPSTSSSTPPWTRRPSAPTRPNCPPSRAWSASRPASARTRKDGRRPPARAARPSAGPTPSASPWSAA